LLGVLERAVAADDAAAIAWIVEQMERAAPQFLYEVEPGDQEVDLDLRRWAVAYAAGAGDRLRRAVAERLGQTGALEPEQLEAALRVAGRRGAADAFRLLLDEAPP